MLYLATYRCSDDDRRSRIGEVVAGLSDNCWNVRDDVWVIFGFDHPYVVAHVPAVVRQAGHHLADPAAPVVIAAAIGRQVEHRPLL